MKVLIKMDQGGFCFWPITESELDLNGKYPYDKYAYENRVTSVEMPEELFNQHKQISRQYHDIQDQIEHLYRHQQGLQPLPTSPFRNKEKE